jgi:hypothetical protein
MILLEPHEGYVSGTWSPGEQESTPLILILYMVSLNIWRKTTQKRNFPKSDGHEKLMIPSESAPQELSNEWPCQKVSIFMGNFCVPPLGRQNSLSVHKELICFRTMLIAHGYEHRIIGSQNITYTMKTIV